MTDIRIRYRQVVPRDGIEPPTPYRSEYVLYRLSYLGEPLIAQGSNGVPEGTRTPGLQFRKLAL